MGDERPHSPDLETARHQGQRHLTEAVALPAADLTKPDQPRHRSSRQTYSAAALAEGGLLTDIAIVLELAAIYLPIFGLIVAPAVPAPFVLLMLRRGARVTLLAGAVAAFLVSLLAGPHFGWRVGLEAFVGLLIGWAMRKRLPWIAGLALGTLVVTTVGFAAVFGVIFITGLPIHDIVAELRNGLGAVAWVVATGATLFGGQAQWLAVRPALATAGLLALRVWPLLLYAYLAAFALPAVALYYAVASVTVRILGYDTIPFPPRWLVRTVSVCLRVVTLPVRTIRQTRRMLRSGRERTRRRVTEEPAR